jgi:tetratricopeptide (TPR) repeat protein
VDKIFDHILDNLVLADLWEEIIKLILNALWGVDLWIAVVFLAAGIFCWLWIGTIDTTQVEQGILRWLLRGTTQVEQRVLRLRLGAGAILVVLALAAIWVNHAVFQREPLFLKNLTGILIMRIVDDDARNSLQGALVRKLNAELQNEPAGQQIEVHASRETIDENEGLHVAHEHARAIGQKLNAKLVIWGLKSGDKKFYQRITVINAPKTWSATSERTDDMQKINELSLPDELVDEPFYLIHFIAGYSYYDQGNYKEALPHFEDALGRHGGIPKEIADLHFFSGFCDQALGTGQKDMTSKFQEAIAHYEKASEAYKENSHDEKASEAYKKNYRKKWAETQNNLGCVYFVLPGDRGANLQSAIASFQEALRVRTEEGFSVDWAETQNNLGNAYAAYAAVTGDRGANLQKAIDAFQEALQGRAARTVPWAMTKFNLGAAYAAYADLPTGNRAENLQSAKACFKNALEIFKETTFRNDYLHAATALDQVERNLAPK